MEDMSLDKNYKKGDKKGKVTLIQEWLCLQGYNVVIDGDFGPATDHAIKQFQGSNGLVADGIVGMKTFEKLIIPMTAALKTISTNGMTIGQMVVAYAQQHLAQHPREIGSQNKGPWVRLYMKGSEGKDWPWCAGFACFVLEQTCKTLNVALPITSSFSSGALAADAKKKGIFLPENKAAKREQITLGSFFLVRKTATRWEHTGLVVNTEQDVFPDDRGQYKRRGQP
jgi:peptidoglycan hydrolase-like protein with peptidoglycan-binding domain